MTFYCPICQEVFPLIKKSERQYMGRSICEACERQERTKIEKGCYRDVRSLQKTYP